MTNYPNPFNPITKIYYTLPKEGNVKITIYNSVGKEVKVLVNEFKGIGSYISNFDGSDLSSGIYFYSIEAGSFIQTKRMILLK
ncbi:MAG: T9SS type A sorting domain-containing protein [Ignavibacteria bacterium]|nr:T9SS type A sorting domain-containing protein [Ignavibacteriota bacterium]